MRSKTEWFFTTKNRVGKQRQGVDMKLAITAPLGAAIEAAREANIVSLNNYVLTQFGKPFTQKSISHRFSERASMAGLPRECTAYGVRKALAKILADNGATSSELKATFGWTTSKLADLYTEQANKRD
jgi:site-specific recombinase XerD